MDPYELYVKAYRKAESGGRAVGLWTKVWWWVTGYDTRAKAILTLAERDAKKMIRLRSKADFEKEWDIMIRRLYG